MRRTQEEKNDDILDFYDKIYATIDFLLKYEFYDGERKDCPIVVVGPDGSEDKKFRVYAYGGRIGRIAAGSGHSQLADTAYLKYLDEKYFSPDNEIDGKYLEYMDEKYVKPGGEKYKGDSLCSRLSCRLQDILNDPCPWQQLDKPEYLDLILKAAEKWSTKKGGDLGERRLQTALVKQHMKKDPKDGWCVVDMEYTVKQKLSPTGKNFTPDMVVFDQNSGFGFIELKYADKSTENLDKHYRDTQNILKNILQSGEAVKIITEELKRRSDYLRQYGLISDAIYQAMKVSDAPKLWQGFLFVGGKRENAVRFAKGMAAKCEGIITDKDCRFAFFPYEEENSAESIRNIRLDFHSMESYGQFTGEWENE